MMLITKDIAEKLDANHGKKDAKPVLKLFTPWGACTWLITERDPKNPDYLFGLADLGMGCPEMGTVSLSEIESVRGPMGLRIERDRWFSTDKTLIQHWKDARAAGRITA